MAKEEITFVHGPKNGREDVNKLKNGLIEQNINVIGNMDQMKLAQGLPVISFNDLTLRKLFIRCSKLIVNKIVF